MNIYQKCRFALMYLGKTPWDTNHSPPELLELIQTVKPGRALDIGCGTATNVITLANNGWQVTGIDFVRRPIELGRKKARLAGVHVNLFVADVTTLELDCRFDLILDMGCFHNLSQAGRERYRQSLKKWINDDGYYLLYGFLKPDAPQASRGIGLSDIQKFQMYLHLQSRQDGMDRHRTSGWFIFQKPGPSRIDGDS